MKELRMIFGRRERAADLLELTAEERTQLQLALWDRQSELRRRPKTEVIARSIQVIDSLLADFFGEGEETEQV